MTHLLRTPLDPHHSTTLSPQDACLSDLPGWLRGDLLVPLLPLMASRAWSRGMVTEAVAASALCGRRQVGGLSSVICDHLIALSPSFSMFGHCRKNRLDNTT